MFAAEHGERWVAHHEFGYCDRILQLRRERDILNHLAGVPGMACITDKMSLRAFNRGSFAFPAGGAGQLLRLLQILKGGTTDHAVFGFYRVHCDLIIPFPRFHYNTTVSMSRGACGHCFSASRPLSTFTPELSFSQEKRMGRKTGAEGYHDTPLARRDSLLFDLTQHEPDRGR